MITNGYSYVLRVHMNQAQRFGAYDYLLNTVLIAGNKVTSQDVGVCTISFVADFTKGKKLVRK